MSWNEPPVSSRNLVKVEESSFTKNKQCSSAGHCGISDMLLETWNVKEEVNYSSTNSIHILDNRESVDEQTVLNTISRVGECPSNCDLHSKSSSSVLKNPGFENLEGSSHLSSNKHTNGSDFVNLSEQKNNCSQKKKNPYSSIPNSLFSEVQNKISENPLAVLEDIKNELVDVSKAFFGERIVQDNAMKRVPCNPRDQSSKKSRTSSSSCVTNVKEKMTYTANTTSLEMQSSSSSLVDENQDSSLFGASSTSIVKPERPTSTHSIFTSVNQGLNVSASNLAGLHSALDQKQTSHIYCEKHEGPSSNHSISQPLKQSRLELTVSDFAELTPPMDHSHQTNETCLATNPNGLFQNSKPANGNISIGKESNSVESAGTKHDVPMPQIDTRIDVPNNSKGLVNESEHTYECQDLYRSKHLHEIGKCKDNVSISTADNLNLQRSSSEKSEPSINSSVDLDDETIADMETDEDGDDDDGHKRGAYSDGDDDWQESENNDSTDDEDFKPTKSKVRKLKQANSSKTEVDKRNGMFLCTICNTAFAKAYNLKRHRSLHTDVPKQNPCSKCAKMFRRKDHVLGHELICLRKCKYCRLKLHSVDECIVHENSCNNAGFSLLCKPSEENVSFDDKEFESDEKIIGNDSCNSKNNVGKVKRRYLCTICNKTFPRSSGLSRHNRVLHTDEPVRFPCAKCGKSFTRLDYTHRHRRTCVCKCKYCGAKFDLEAECNTHENGCTSDLLLVSRNRLNYKKPHKEQGIERYFCDICKKEFKNWKSMHRHNEHHHTEPIKCKICHVVCKNVGTYKYHFKVKHTAKETQTWLCTFCGKSFHCKTHFRFHEARHAGTGKKYPCDMCDKVFDCQSYLTKHLYVHSEVRNHLCRHCGMAFKLITHLRSHEMTHNDRIFKCKVCDKGFKTPESVLRHQTVHTGVKAFKCSFCDKHFSQQTAKNNHELIHKGIKRHTCEFCGKKFTLRHQLRQHLKTHSNARPYVCKVCGDGFKIGHHLTQHMSTHDNKLSKR